MLYFVFTVTKMIRLDSILEVGHIGTPLSLQVSHESFCMKAGYGNTIISLICFSLAVESSLRLLGA